MSTSGHYHPPVPRQVRATGVTNSAGNVVFTWPAGTFAAPPVITVGLQGASGFRSHSITANSATSTTVNVLASAGITVLGIGVLAVGTPAAGITVHVTATAAP